MNYIIDHIPRDTPRNRRPGHPMTAETITIHNTGNASSTARNERAWLTNINNGMTASYHIVVDEWDAIECIPLDENAWHAGDGGNGPGNRTSIGIEICESGNYAQTLDNAAQLVAKLLKERGWGVDRLRRHWDWTRKVCPRLMYDGGKWTGWTAFCNMVDYKLKSITLPAIQGKAKVVVGDKQAAGYIIDGRVYMPSRFVSEALGRSVKWDNSTKTAYVE